MSRLLFAHATGFSSGVWDPVVAEVGGDPVVLDFPGHGGTAEPEKPFTWWVFGEYVGGAAEPGWIGVGHSMGGAALLMAELLEPGKLAALVLIEPIVFPRADVEFIEAMADQAERRRSQWPDRDTARAHLSAKPVFDRWDAKAMDGYLRTGLVDADDGGVRLACRPRFEAAVYRESYSHGVWERLGEVGCPVLVLAGSESNTFPPGHAELLAERIPRARGETVADTGHFLPMERPQVVVEAIARIRDQIAE